RPVPVCHPGIGTSTNIKNVGPPYSNPPDHLYMDLFTMPVVEPYPISEPFSTAGKINLNYQIMPFGDYITRDTALRSLLRSEQLTLIPVDAKKAAHSETGYSDDGSSYRHEIDENTTLAFI